MATDKKYLFYERNATFSGDKRKLLFEEHPTWLWNDRLLLVQHTNDREFWYFTALDLVTNETRPIHFLKSDSKFRQVNVVSLNKNYGFIIESVGDSFCVNLVKLNWAPGKFQLIERLDQQDQFSGILVSNLNPTKFVLRQLDGGRFIYQACTLDSGKIELGGDVYESETFFEHYFNNKLYVYGMDGNFEVEIYDWMTKKSNLVQIDVLPNVDVDINRVEWIKERLYASFYCFDTETYGIGYTDLVTKRWNFLDLDTSLRISKMQFFGGNLLVYATDNFDEDDIFGHSSIRSPYCSKFKFYSIPTQHPQSLCKMAWPLVVQALKSDKLITDPYQAAARFLPFNSDLRPPWYSDETALENLEEPESNVNSAEGTTGKTSESKLSKESSDAVPSKRGKFN